MKEIPLTQGQIALVDDEDFDWLNQWKWYAHWNKHNQSFYASRTDCRFSLRKKVYMHRAIMNTPKELDCDHANHNTLDNRKENLRNITNSQNMMNRRGAASHNKLGERCIIRKGSGFQVQVGAGGRRVYAKTFRTLEAAIIARDSALKKYHGEFARVQEGSER